jgi:hypothetical protein
VEAARVTVCSWAKSASRPVDSFIACAPDSDGENL